MPNHVHGIVVIDKPVETPNLGVSDSDTATTANLNVETPKLVVETPKLVVETPNLGVETPNLGVSTKKWKPGTLGVIINQYKRAVTIGSRKINPHFEWQSRFHDHIIRNDASFQRISEYIKNNPANWKDDKFYG